MTKQETTKALEILKLAYPAFYKDMGVAEARQIIDLWSSMFADDDSRLVLAAIKTHLALDEKGYPPHIGAIKNAIFKITDRAYAMTADEAWEIARKTMTTIGIGAPERVFENGEYRTITMAQKAQELTPPIVWEVMSNIGYSDMCRSENKDVLRGQFVKIWSQTVERRRERALIPKDVQQLIGTDVPALLEKVAVYEK